MVFKMETEFRQFLAFPSSHNNPWNDPKEAFEGGRNGEVHISVNIYQTLKICCVNEQVIPRP